METPVPPGGDGSVFIVYGDDHLAGFYGDSIAPLRFAFLEKIGFVYLGGKGKKIDPNGNITWFSLKKQNYILFL